MSTADEKKKYKDIRIIYMLKGNKKSIELLVNNLLKIIKIKQKYY